MKKLGKSKWLMFVMAVVITLPWLFNTVENACASTITGATDTDDFIRGVDVSTLDMLEDLGAKYYVDGEEEDALTILSDNGANYVRLKLWVDPYDEDGNAYGGGNNDYATTLSLAKRAKALGMDVLIDFHLSDFWADPSNQYKPKAWEDLSFSELKTTLYNYMKDTLDDFVADGVTPDMIQVGNEISAGILFDDGAIEDDDFSNLAELLESAIAGVRASDASSTKIILHLDQGGQNSLYTWFFEGLLEESPDLDFDVFGLSYYPMWHGTLEGLQYNLNYLATTYDKEVCIVETAYAWTTDDADEDGGNVFVSGDDETCGYEASTDGQIAFMNDLVSILLNVPDDKGLGFFYWEPEWIPVAGGTYATSAGVAYKNDTVTPSNTWDNMTLFDFNGNVLDSIQVLNQPSENLLSNISFETDGVTTTPSGWNVWLDSSTASGTVKTEYGNAFDGDYKLTFWDDEDYSCSIYKTFTNLENGTYRFSVWAMTNGEQDTLQLYAKNYGGSELNTAITTSDINWNIFTIDEIEVTNNTLEIGVYTVADADDWCNLDLAILRKID